MKYSRMSLTLLTCWALSGCVTSGAGERFYTPPEESPFIKTMSAMGAASRAGNFAEAEKQAIAAMAISSPFDLGNESYAIAFNYLASLYLKQRKHTEAGVLFRSCAVSAGVRGRVRHFTP